MTDMSWRAAAFGPDGIVAVWVEDEGRTGLMGMAKRSHATSDRAGGTGSVCADCPEGLLLLNRCDGLTLVPAC